VYFIYPTEHNGRCVAIMNTAHKLWAPRKQNNLFLWCGSVVCWTRILFVAKLNRCSLRRRLCCLQPLYLIVNYG